MLKRISLKDLIFFITFEIIFTAVTLPFCIYYGPFNNVKETMITTAMTTLNHQYLATLFVPKNVIQKIMSENKFKGADKMEKLLKFVNYHDANIEMYNISGRHFKGNILLIHDPSKVVVGFSSKLPKEGETTSAIAEKSHALAAINAGGFGDSGWKGTGGAPQGFIIHEGKFVYQDAALKDDRPIDLIGIDKNGVLVTGKYSILEMKAMEIKEGVSFGPPLIINGEPLIKHGNGGWGISPRTAIGQKRDGTIIFLTIDGRQLKSIGATLKDVQDVLLEYGAYNAANLDGGSSTTMFYKGKVVNNPSDALGERSVPSVFMVMP